MEHYVICVRSNQEARSRKQIERNDRSARVYYPLTKNVIKPRRYRSEKTILRPLFPGYIFVGFPFRVNWYAIKEASACVGFVHFDGKPAYVNDDVIFFMKRQEHYESMDWPAPIVPELASKKVKVGDTIRVNDGPLSGHDGKVLKRMKASVKVELRLFGQPTEAEMPYELFQILNP